MARSLKGLLALILVLTLAAPALAAVVTLPPAVAPGVAPQWTSVPTSPRVYYAPNLSTDLFRVKHHYYYYYGGNWYQGRSAMGPWRPVRKIPKPILRVRRPYFKTPAPW
jgi:hypothetical protein